MSNANHPGAAGSGPGDPLVLVGGHIVSPQDGFGEIGRMANGDLRRPSRIAVGLLGFHAPAASPSVFGALELGGNLTWTTDNVNDIGGVGVNRARDFRLGRDAFIGRNVLIGTAVPATDIPALDVIGSSALVISDIITDAATKVGRFGARHFTNAEKPTALIVALNTAASNVVTIGGASSAYNTATVIQFHTAANNTTVTGTLAADITGVGVSSLLNLRGDLRISALSGTNVSVGVNDSGGLGFKLLRVPN